MSRITTAIASEWQGLMHVAKCMCPHCIFEV